MVKPIPASPLAALVAQVDEQRIAASDDASDDAAARHKELVRAAGRAALEESLNPTQPMKELTVESLTAEWQAYAEVFGTNGLAAGSGRLSARPAAEVAPPRGQGHQTVPRRHHRLLLLAGLAAAVALIVARRSRV